MPSNSLTTGDPLSLRHSGCSKGSARIRISVGIFRGLVGYMKTLFTCILDRSSQTIQCSVKPDHVQQVNGQRDGGAVVRLRAVGGERRDLLSRVRGSPIVADEREVESVDLERVAARGLTGTPAETPWTTVWLKHRSGMVDLTGVPVRVWASMVRVESKAGQQKRTCDERI
ncbi:hypothetical protein B0T24DRAFT_218117 [Lasiosphaeria ovina]|uniref:Uncharacterized protein n=1 Tax=Lasiosphaeria ovina TaxID=92902 RepID=A0AAE0KHH2_9PEZI|nr:hypothetical protein B0T24DRAFT_218117 [Lasiosphaeria ovina]